MFQLILHLVGDYITQSQWMANGKTQHGWIAAVHATVYALPFALIGPWQAVAAPPPSLFGRLGALWCRAFHTKAMWPIKGKYICSSCLRETPVSWEVSGGLR